MPVATELPVVLDAALQPIVSSSGKVIGHEALLRGCDPAPLFSAARHGGWQLALDIQAAELAVEAAGRLQVPGELLFLNVAPGPVADLRLWLATVCAHPEVRLADLVIEVSEKQSDLTGPDFAGFVHAVRGCGARVALDDVEPDAEGVAILDAVRPDVVKLSRRAALGALDEPVRTGVRQIVRAAQGALVVAECVEQQAQAEALSRCGVTAFQGWLMGRPAVAVRPDTTWGGLSRLSLLA